MRTRNPNFRKITKKELSKLFLHAPLMGYSMVITDRKHHAILYFEMEPIGTSYEFFEVGRAVYRIDEKNHREILFSDGLKIESNNGYVSHYGSELDVLEYIEHLPRKIFQADIRSIENFINTEKSISFHSLKTGTAVYAGDSIILSNYDDGSDYFYPDLSGLKCTVRYCFKSNEFIAVPKEPFRGGIRAFCKATKELCYTYYGHAYRSFPLERCKFILDNQ